MTDRIDPKAIADELREAARDAASERYVVEWDKALVEQMLTRAADTIDALVKEMHARELHLFEEEQTSAGLAAVVEKVRLMVENEGDKFRPIAARLGSILSSAPADALAEHDAALIESLAEAWDWDHIPHAAPRVRFWLSDRARQVREGEA